MAYARARANRTIDLYLKIFVIFHLRPLSFVPPGAEIRIEKMTEKLIFFAVASTKRRSGNSMVFNF